MKTTKLPNCGGISSHDSEFNGLKKGLSLNPSAATKLLRQTRVVISEYKISQKLKSIQDPRPLQSALSLPLPTE